MILDNHLDVPADPDAVFALINDVERVAGCMPGAILDGRQDDIYHGRVRFKIGPISAAYAGKIRFTEVDTDRRILRLSARGADSHGNGDAEAEITLIVAPAPDGSTLDLHTDLVIRGKIAQFGKSAISAVSNRLLDQFAGNLAALLQEPALVPAGAAPTGAAPASQGVATSVPAAAVPVGAAMLLPPNAGRLAAVAAAMAAAFFQGWLLGRIRAQDILIEELRRAR